MKFSGLIGLLLSLFLFSSASATDYSRKGKNTFYVKADVVTGFNRLLGNPLWNLGPGLDTFGFDTMGAYQPDNYEASKLEPDMGGDTLLATYVDPVFLSLYGLNAGAVPSEHLNLPLRDVLVAVGPSGLELASLPSIKDAGILDYSRATSNGDVTLEKWLRASGKASLRCKKKSSEVSMELKGLIPNGLYTVSGVFMTPDGPHAIPLGGVPNAFVTDRQGKAKFRRHLNFCIGDNENPGQLLIIDVTWHSNQALYGTQTNLPFAGSFAGIGNHIHLSFLVSGQAL